jgi:hypothetical protein
MAAKARRNDMDDSSISSSIPGPAIRTYPSVSIQAPHLGNELRTISARGQAKRTAPLEPGPGRARCGAVRATRNRRFNGIIISEEISRPRIDLIRRAQSPDSRRKRQTLKAPPRHVRIRDGGDQSHPPTAGRATQRSNSNTCFKRSAQAMRRVGECPFSGRRSEEARARSVSPLPSPSAVPFDPTSKAASETTRGRLHAAAKLNRADGPCLRPCSRKNGASCIAVSPIASPDDGARARRRMRGGARLSSAPAAEAASRHTPRSRTSRSCPGHRRCRGSRSASPYS